VRRLARRLRLRSERGFTLVELVTSMTILLVVLSGITAAFVSGSRAQSDTEQRFDAQTQLRLGVDRLRREIHSACSASTSSASSVTLLMPSDCSTTSVTWCTQGSGSRYGLYRAAGATCSGGVKVADYLTTGSVFAYTAPDTPSGSHTRARLHVDLPVDVKPGDGHAAYELVDDIVLRNSTR